MKTFNIRFIQPGMFPPIPYCLKADTFEEKNDFFHFHENGKLKYMVNKSVVMDIVVEREG